MKNSNHLLHMATALLGLATATFTGCHKKDSPAPDLTPVITSSAPAEAAEGATVVITGKNFDADKTKNAVKFNGTEGHSYQCQNNGAFCNRTRWGYQWQDHGNHW